MGTNSLHDPSAPDNAQVLVGPIATGKCPGFSLRIRDLLLHGDQSSAVAILVSYGGATTTTRNS